MSSEILQKLVRRDPVATSQLVELLASHDPVVKQLTADYVAYAHCSSGREDLSLLVTNLLSRDCRDPNPNVAGSAVTALAALSTAPDAALDALLLTLDSPHPKVRRCAAAASLRFGRAHATTAASTGLSDKLYERLRDTDPLVVANSLVALDHILASEGGVVINRPIAKYLFSRLGEFTDSSLETVLGFLKRYSPRDDKERFELLNPLDACFQTDSPGVLTAAVDLFLQWTTPHPNLRTDLIRLIQPTFCRIFITSSPEVCYLLTEFLVSLGDGIRDLFNPHYKYFSPNPNDPVYLKERKFELFGLIALPVNVLDFIAEIYPYCSDFNSYNQAIKCLGVLGQVSDKARDKVYSILPELLAGPSEKIIAAGIECLLFLSSCQSSYSQTCGNKSTANVLDELGEGEVDKFPLPVIASNPIKNTPPNDAPNTTRSTKSTSGIILPSTLKEALSRVLFRSSLVEQHPSLVLHALCAPISLDVECSVACLEQLQERQSTLSAQTQCLLLSTAARLFVRQPAQCYVILCRALTTGANSDLEAVRSRTALVCATLQQEPEAASLLLLGNVEGI